MSDQYILNEAGEPVECPDLRVWGEWFQTPGNRRVAEDFVGVVRVSTVFLALDHAVAELEAGPILWETLVFGGDLDGEGDRYRTREAALAGHQAWVARLKARE